MTVIVRDIVLNDEPRRLGIHRGHPFADGSALTVVSPTIVQVRSSVQNDRAFSSCFRQILVDPPDDFLSIGSQVLLCVGSFGDGVQAPLRAAQASAARFNLIADRKLWRQNSANMMNGKPLRTEPWSGAPLGRPPAVP